MRVLVLHDFFYFPNSSLYRLSPPKNLHRSEYFISQPTNQTFKNLNRNLLKVRLFITSTLSNGTMDVESPTHFFNKQM